MTDLRKRLRAFEAIYRNNDDAVLLIVLDNDTRTTALFYSQLEAVAKHESITIDHVFCVAVEEMEAWMLGDSQALKAAYPAIADRIDTKLLNYQQDSICGTWEVLADIVTRGGIGSFRKQNPTPFDVGRMKSVWAESIGQYLDIRNNQSPSFQRMVNELDKRRA